jgi:D-hexose-6-phosphate mutarotase
MPRCAEQRVPSDHLRGSSAPHFAVSDITTVAIAGLAGTVYIDKPEAGRRKRQTTALVTIGTETDRVYLDTPARCVIEDRGWRRRIIIEKKDAASTVVWNPWADKGAGMADLGDPAWRGMVCVETGNISDNEVRLAKRGRTPDVDRNLRRCRGMTSAGPTMTLSSSQIGHKPKAARAWSSGG